VHFEKQQQERAITPQKKPAKSWGNACAEFRKNEKWLKFPDDSGSIESVGHTIKRFASDHYCNANSGPLNHVIFADVLSKVPTVAAVPN